MYLTYFHAYVEAFEMLARILRDMKIMIEEWVEIDSD